MTPQPTGRPFSGHLASIRAKLVLALLLATVPTAAILAYFGLESSTNSVRSQVLDRMQILAMTQARRVEDAVARATADARHVARTPTVRAFAAACARPEGPSAEARQQALEQFVALAEASRVYWRIAYLDPSGRERARVDYGGGQTVAVPASRLRDRSQSPHIHQAIAAATADEVYVSPLHLNRRGNGIEQPGRPAMIFASRVVNGGRSLGVVVLNLHIGPILPAAPQGVGEAFVVDSEGWYLSHTVASKAWSGPTNLNTGHNLRNDLPTLVHDMMRPEPAALQASGHLIGTWPITIDTPPSPTHLTVGVDAPEAVVLADLHDFRRFFWILIAISFVVPVLAGLALAAYFLRPLETLHRAVHALARGNLNTTADVTSGDEFQELATDFNAMAARLRQYQQEERLAIVGRMASGLIHDIKNPLNSITALARLLATRDMPNDEREALADKTVAQVQRIAGMLQEILDFSRGAPLEPVAKVVSVQKLLSDLRPELEADCSRLGMRLIMETNDSSEVRADPERLRRAIVNIATNGIEAMGKEGTLTIRAAREEHGVRIAIADTGPGIPVEVADRLLEPFVTHGKPNGTGLGLAISNAIVGAHGGTLEVANQPEGGALVTVWLPAAQN